MRQILLVILLLVATTCFATERLVFLSGDSEIATMLEQLPPPGDGYECTELVPPVVNSPICDISPGDWVGNGAFVAYYSIQPDVACFALGCNNGNTPLNGRRFKGNREGFLQALQNVLNDPVSGGGLQENGANPAGNPKKDMDDITPTYPFWADKHTTLQSGDVLHLWIQGTGGMAVVEGVEIPCFYLAWSDDYPHPPACETYGGELLLPSYTGTNSHIIGLKQIAEAIDGQGTVILYLVFAHAGAWTAYLDNYIVWAGAEANEPVYLCDEDEENALFWPGFAETYFPLIESTICISNAWIGYRNSDGVWDPYSYDLNHDYDIWFSEACDAAEILNNQNGTARNIPTGQDFKIWNQYPNDDPIGGGGGVAPPPDIYPNPFNPTAQISFQVPMKGPAKVVVYDLLGRQIAVLFDGIASQGIHKVSFDGSTLASGLYFVRISSGQTHAIAKMYLLK